MKISSKSMVPVAMLWMTCAVAGCGGDDDAAVTGKPTGATCDETLTYVDDGQPFINQYCIRCHVTAAVGPTRNDAPVGVDFDNLSMVQTWSVEMELQAGAGPDAVNTLMPGAGETPQPTEAERSTFAAWLACGPDQ